MRATGSWLTVDQGNTSLDAVRFGLDGELCVEAEWRGLDDEGLASIRTELFERSGDLLGVCFSSVRGGESAARLGARLEQLFGAAHSPDCGLELAVTSPETTGKDRLFAARAARELAGGRAAIVVDVGTAMTVDLVADGAFQGGAIAPGPALLARALGGGAAQLFEVEPRAGVAALGRDTRSALEAGVVVGLRGAARALVEGLTEAHLGSDAPTIFVTGGARGLLLEPAGFLPGAELLEVPLLVHLGLLFAAGLELDGVESLVARHVAADQ